MSSILGPHAQIGSDAAKAWFKVAPCGKAVDQVSLLKLMRPDAFKVHRHYWPNQALSNNASMAADAAIATLGGWNDPLLFVEGYNEVSQSFNTDLARLIDWYAVFSRRCHDRGYRSCGPGFSVGNPPDGDGGTAKEAWLMIQGKNFGEVDLLLINEYFGSYSPVPVAGREWAESTILRHRWIHKWTNGQHPPLFLGETGYDAVEVGGSPVAYSGFRLRPSYGETGYLTDLKLLEIELQKDIAIGVIGAVVYEAGPVLPQWREFDVDPMHLENHFYGPPPAWWTPQEDPVPYYVIDSATRQAIAARGWTPASDYVVEAGGGHVFCEQGICYYLNGPALFKFVNFQ